jgi:hypothetical protein
MICAFHSQYSFHFFAPLGLAHSNLLIRGEMILSIKQFDHRVDNALRDIIAIAYYADNHQDLPAKATVRPEKPCNILMC